MKIGDKVRFLSETGGGKVAGFQGKDIVLVEDEDGFQIPTAVSDVVVVEDDDYSTRRLVENKMRKPEAVPSDDEDYDPADRPVTFKAPVEERKGGEQLNAFLAFVPMDIKAISNFDRAEKDSIYFEGVNHAVLGYEPGSVVKPISMMIALEDKVVSPNEKIATGRSFPYRGGKPISDSHAYTSLTPAEIIAASSNIGMSKITIRGFEDNPGRFYSRMKQIGMLDPLNIGIAGETVPRIDSLGNKNWDCIDLTRTSYGYRTQIPPIYTLAMYNAMANGGKFVRPRLVKELWKNEMCDSVIPVSYVRDRVCSPENAKLMRDMLTAVVWSDKGTGKALRNNFVKIAGKTGTCYMIDGETGKYVYTRKRMAFCGFFPADNPKYSCMVLIAHPINAGAARSSGMVLMNTALKMYARGMLDNISDYRKEEKPERTFATLYNINQDTRKELQATLKDANEVIRHRRTDKGVPSVIGMGSRDAIRILEKAGLNVKKIEGEGYVCAQSLQPGTDYKRGSNISLQLKKY